MSRLPTIATLGSHSALQILKGARDEGLPNLVVAAAGRDALYRRYPFIDQVRSIPRYADFEALEGELSEAGCVMVPHGSFVAYLGEEVNQRMRVGYYGNRGVLRWEADRALQRQWLEQAEIRMPREFKSPDAVDDWPVLIKTDGAAGGSGYFLARTPGALERRLRQLDGLGYTIQHYVVGVTLYVHYFQSLVHDRLEILSMDRRYETNVDGLGRLPHQVQQEIDPQPSYVVVGNSPLVLRESMLEEAYRMGERVVETSKALIGGAGIWGPFCLETIITPDLRFHVIEISCRIVAGTNIFVDGSPYAALFFDEPMSTGRRIAREIKEAHALGRLGELIDEGPGA
ncbi:MAG: formate--phosphoribosylaminoimidazolecarboxamide ligase [Caldilineae bacterium]|nr:formate--phosphoribosylaminoimidazolecarboxamide ligase [Caldilineae bacterium]